MGKAAGRGKGVLRGKPASKKATKQQAFSQVGLLPELKKPAEAIGNGRNFRGPVTKWFAAFSCCPPPCCWDYLSSM